MSTKVVKKKSAEKKSADNKKKPNTQTIRRKKYSTVLEGMQPGSQGYQVLDHMIRKGKTTSLEIATLFYLTNPSAVMSDLRKRLAKEGVGGIETKMVAKTGEYGKIEKKYGEFSLIV